MPYRRSEPLERWRGERRADLQVLVDAHATTGEVSGPGRPLGVSRPLAHAYVIAMVGQFQGFIRDLHDLATQQLVDGSGADARFVVLLTKGMARDRQVDRGNADLRAIRTDFGRIGLTPLDLGTHDVRWPMDRKKLSELIRLRNVLAHGNEAELGQLNDEGLRDTVSWARARLPALNRVAQSLDHFTWDRLHVILQEDPWR